MPSERFHRLSKEKQNLIWKASMKEFIAVPYEKFPSTRSSGTRAFPEAVFIHILKIKGMFCRFY